MNKENNKMAPLKMASSVIVFFTLVLGSVCLKSQVGISEASFDFFIIASLFVSIFICYSNRIHTLEIAKCKLILKETKQTEQSVKELALAVVEFSEASSGGLMLESHDAPRKERAIQRIKELTT